MNIAEQIYETVKTLPEQIACEVLNFAQSLKAKQAAEHRLRRENALSTLANIAAVIKLKNSSVKIVLVIK
ncbi:DUF2281 domain-containing protein [Methylomonas fluvii]|uniref:DUF2281 domain-containing protein n=1 Tax=Methylomonas fluvii TaxID=1854564 RepID=UPI001CE0A1A4|nr:DUF2281 domain-containing protein [Methylomonas fluvii]